MNQYDPSTAPDPDQWLALQEAEQIELVRLFHEQDEEYPLPEDQIELHSGVHVAVENQLAMGVEPVPATLARLMRQGLDRHEAIHAIGAVLTAQAWRLQQGKESSWNPGAYRRRLDKITAKRWRKGQY